MQGTAELVPTLAPHVHSLIVSRMQCAACSPSPQPMPHSSDASAAPAGQRVQLPAQLQRWGWAPELAEAALQVQPLQGWTAAALPPRWCSAPPACSGPAQRRRREARSGSRRRLQGAGGTVHAPTLVWSRSSSSRACGAADEHEASAAKYPPAACQLQEAAAALTEAQTGHAPAWSWKCAVLRTSGSGIQPC